MGDIVKLPAPRPTKLTRGLTRLSDVVPTELEPLWPGFIYRNKLNILDGPSDVGKSTVLLDFAARLTTGTAMPLGTGPALEPMNVLLMTAEDDLADTVTHRFTAAGGDLTRLIAFEYRIEKETDENGAEIKNGADVENSYISLDSHLPEIEAAIEETEAGLLIVDVLMAYMGDTNSYKDQEIRPLFTKIGKMAARRGCAVVMIRHPKKDNKGNAKDSGGGSAGITNAARSVFRADTHPDDPELRVLASVVLNIGQRPPALSYRLVACPTSMPKTTTTKIEWLDIVEVTADQLVAGPQREKTETPQGTRQADRCAAFILGLFDEVAAADDTGRKSVDATWARERVNEAGYNSGQMNEGRDIAGVKAIRADGFWSWHLAAIEELDLTDNRI